MSTINFAELKVDAILITRLPNVRYLSRFTGSSGIVLLTPDSATLFTDPRYTIQAEAESTAKVRTAKGPLIKAAIQAIKRKGLRRIGFEKAHVSYESWQTLKEDVPLGTSLKPLAGVVEKLRLVKRPDEVERIRRSVHTNSAAFASVVRKIRPGMSENDLAAEIDYQMRRRGAERTSFDTIVAAGLRTALPHARPTRHAFANHELVLIDMGATQDGYTSDMTRVVALGKPDAKARKMYDAVLEAQLSALAAVRQGVTAHYVDRAARDVLRSKGLEKQFTHSTGHGLGLEIHEAPRLAKKEKTRLEEGMVITIEPGVYIKGLGGVRIEDTVLVTKNGCEVLTPTSKELMIL